ncbi:hypothetical protein [Pseudocitrobacter sp. MW920760]|uniref:hypothetical protein n=1 Tax=Pseudocitrobacter sp. MW920760 TaxID=2981140 RepID=UPI002E1973DF|nr:hypothetical protein [Pseudocitrobacter sp. MW920760]
MNVFEMEGFLRGKCLPGDMRVNETTAEYLVRKLGQAGELTAAHSTLEKVREVTNCPDGVDLQDHLKQLVAENVALKQQEPKAWYVRTSDEVITDPAEAKKWRGIPLVMANIETPATDSILREAEVRGVEKFADKRGFSFQHGSIHAHFGNGDVMVGSVTFENGDAGINFAPVREKTGGVGTHYEWTKSKTAEEVDSVFVITSSSVAGLEVIQGKLAEAIEQLREGKAE